MPDHGDNANDVADQQYAIKLRDDAQICYNAVYSTICKPVQSYFDRIETIEIDISLKKMHTTSIHEDAATAAKNRMELEPTVDPELVKDLIRAQVVKDTKKLNSEVGQLKRQITSLLSSNSGGNSKNGRRGQTGGASNAPKKVTKKNSRGATASTTNTRSQGRAQKAGAQGSVSLIDGKNKKRTKKKKKNAPRN